MHKKIALLLIVAIVLITAVFLSRNTQKNSLYSPLTTQLIPKQAVITKILPSETAKTYSDPAGFSFNYPDNVSITNNEITDNSTYSDIQLFAKGINGSLSLKITDSKFKSLDEWIKKNAFSQTPKETKLGSLKALEVKTADRLLLASLDQGILFTIEVPLIEQDFWMKVYGKVIAEFTFAPPAQTSTSQQTNTNSSSDDVSFEGEEVIE